MSAGGPVSAGGMEVGKGISSRGLRVTTVVPASVTVENSFIHSDDDLGADAVNVFAEDPDGPVVFRAIGNRISLHGQPDSGSGIALAWIRDGSVRADIMNKTIWDVGRCNCGADGGIAIVPQGGPTTADVNLVGNTIDTSQSNGIGQRNSLTPGGHLSLDVFDNIFSHLQVFGLRLTTDSPGGPGSLTFRAGHNDFYQTNGNSLDGQSAGSGNVHKDPRFVDRSSGNFRLKATSPLIDTGVVCSPGGIANVDAAGHGRLRGSSVDIGAYEYGAGTPSGVALVGTGGGNTLDGTSGDDILCGYAGNDTLTGKGGRDYLHGGSDDDLLIAGSGSDRSYGGSGKDTVCSRDGVSGNDRSDGGSGSDKGRTDSGDTRVSIEASASC